MINTDIINRGWYMPFCNNDEIDRILLPQTAKDYILQERANIVADNMRYLRVYMNKARFYPNWSFEQSFITKHYQTVLEHLNPEDRNLCEEISYGDMFSNDVNGYAYRNAKWGKYVCLNEALQFYMKFCNLALLDFPYDVPLEIRLNSLRIAIRILLKQEAMDFFMDPRGIVPKKIGKIIHQPIEFELQYIAGHEFSHVLCGHLDDKNTVNKPFLRICEKEYFQPIYNTSQKQEFEADIESLKRPNYENKTYTDLLKASLLWFASLELGEAAQEFMSPSTSLQVKTHPLAEERFNNILENTKLPRYYENSNVKNMKENTKILKEALLEDMSLNIELYEFYGSVYLDKPNTKWRGKELIDRVDYY